MQKSRPTEKEARKERRAEALRRNLQRRKLQQRGRASGKAVKDSNHQAGR
jgi:hypothetical protein